MLEVADDVSDSGTALSHDKSNIFRQKQDKPVFQLRPLQPHISQSTDTILAVTQLLKKKRATASLIVNAVGAFVGILTDTDITRRVVAKHVNPACTDVLQVITRNPTCVLMSDSAMDALTKMVENRFRHLPVVDKDGAVVGLLDIAKCLNDAISKLELTQRRSSIAAEDAVLEAIHRQGGSHPQTAALQALLGEMMKKAFGSLTSPTLGSLLVGKPSTVVCPDTSIREAGMLMTERRKAALVVDSGELVGIFGFRDMMTRAVAMGLPLDTTPISDVMTSNPEYVSPETTVLEALQIMHDQHILTLPVCQGDGAVMGLVNIMDVIVACGGSEGWRSIFNTTIDIEDASVSTSGMSNKMKTNTTATMSRKSSAGKSPYSLPYVTDLPPNIPSTLEFVDDDGNGSFTGSTIGDERGVSKILSPEDMSVSLGAQSSGTVAFKVSCPSGATHRIRCEPRIEDLVDSILSKINIPRSRVRIEYDDDEGDTVIVTSDDDVKEAWKLARKAGSKLAKLKVVAAEKKSNTSTALLAGGGLTAVTILGALAMVLMKPRK
jgi:CBS domain-containing protein